MDEPNKHRRLPEAVKFEETPETKDDGALLDHQAGRETKRDFVLRDAG